MDSAVPDNIETAPYIIPAAPLKEVFRLYDIRGRVASDSLTPSLAYAVGLSVGSEAKEQGQTEVIVGRDGRLSGPELARAVCAGLRASGVHVLSIGMVPTPLLYFATHRLASRSGIMITASHNPADHNGFKIVLNGTTLSSDGIQSVYRRIVERRFTRGQGHQKEITIDKDYLDYVTAHIQLARSLKVVVDCGNGVAGNLVPSLYRRLGCEVETLFCDVDGRFPHHHPDPTIPENLQALIQKVRASQADIGIAFDGDADRLGVVTDRGEIIWPDRQMMLFSIDLLSRRPGSDIIFDVKCSRHLSQVIQEHGGHPVMWRTGHSVLKAKLFEMNALLAGEMSGHIFFKDEWFGFDDGMYVGARLLRILSNSSKRCSEVFDQLPNSINTPELKLPMAEEYKQRFMQRLLRESDFGDGKIITIDGLRVEFPEGWGLIRPSNTSPYLILRFEADTEEGLQRIQKLFRRQLLRLDQQLVLPF